MNPERGRFRPALLPGGVCIHPEIEDCFHNQRYLRLVRDYWGRRTQNRRACCSTAR